MEKAQVINRNGQAVGTIELPEAVFGYPIKEHLLYEAVISTRSNQRRGTAATKTRAQVSGSNRKPWRQKGTGRARAGATRSPLWRHGGTTFGPQPKSFATALPKEARKNALRSALAAKRADGRILIVDDLALAAPKTKDAAALLKGLNVASALVVDAQTNASLFTALRNVPRTKAVAWERVGTHDVLAYDWLVISQPAFTSLMEKLQ
jgi:large subunit ribosomal protein L4